jgi:Transposase DDE domain group 1
LQLERVRAAQTRGRRVELWFQDEARVGQKNTLTRVWGQPGSRPAAPKDLGFASAYLFGAVCPSEGKAAALIMPICNTAAMNHHLSEISSQVAVDAHAVVKECQLDLFADRTSAATMRTNQLRLWFASMAYVLLCALRRLALQQTQFAKATCGTIRLKLLKIGALVRTSVRRITFAMASSYPYQRDFARAHAQLINAVTC